MKTCCHCHIPQPLDNFGLDASRPDGREVRCRICRSEIRKPQAKEEYAAQKESLAQRLAAKRSQIRLEDPARDQARRQRKHQRYYAKYREKILAKNAAYDATHPGAANKRSGKWAKAHPEQTQVFCATRRARVNNAPVVEPISLEVLAKRDHWTCHICKKKVTRNTWSHDHLIPLSKGGDHTYLNVALCHQRCNSKNGTGRLTVQLRLLP